MFNVESVLLESLSGLFMCSVLSEHLEGFIEHVFDLRFIDLATINKEITYV